MTDRSAGGADLTGIDPEDVVTPPVTGEAAIDDALLGIAELSSLPLAEHHDRLTRAHETLHGALQSDPTTGDR